MTSDGVIKMADQFGSHVEEAVLLTFAQRARIVEELREAIAGIREGVVVYGDAAEQERNIVELEEIVDILNTPGV